MEQGEDALPRMRVFAARFLQRAQLALQGIGRLETGAHLNELFRFSGCAREEIDLESRGGLHVSHCSVAAVEFVKNGGLERMTGVGSAR